MLNKLIPSPRIRLLYKLDINRVLEDLFSNEYVITIFKTLHSAYKNASVPFASPAVNTELTIHI